MQANLTVVVIVVAYTLFMLWIGWYSSTKVKNNTDFVVAGRRLGPLMMAGTLAATEIGGGSSLGVVQNGMSGFGLSASWYISTMGLAFIILCFLAPKFRLSGVKTVPEYFRRRYGQACGCITSIIMLLPLIGLTAGQIIASAVICSTMLGISYKTAVIIISIVITLYSIMGGLWSVTITDNVQIFLIVAGMIIAVPFALNFAGGWDAVVANIPEGTLKLLDGPGKSYGIIDIISLTIMYVATFAVGQEAVSRYYATKDTKAAAIGSLGAAVINFVYAFIPTILGIIMLALINMGKFSASDFANVGARYALPVLAMEVMPPIICGFLFAGIISATMSSADSDMLGAGAIFANDIYKQFIRKNAGSKEVMRVTQISMFLVGVVSMLIALYNTQSIVSILMFSFTLRAAGSLFPYIMGMYWKGASKAGTIASLIAGTVIVVYLEQFSGGNIFGMHISQPIIPGLVAGFVFFIIFSIIMPPETRTTELAPEEDI